LSTASECLLLAIETFKHGRGGNVLYKALAHPVAAEAFTRLSRTMAFVLVDPDAIAAPLLTLAPSLDVRAVYDHDTLATGQLRAGHCVRALTDLPQQLAGLGFPGVLVAAFDAEGLRQRIMSLLPPGFPVVTLDSVRLPPVMLTRPVCYLDPLNFATNFAFFRDDDCFGTRLCSANYWFGYGAADIRLFLRLYAADGTLLAQWQQPLPAAAGAVMIDSAEVRRRFALPPFIGQLFIHAAGVRGHDVVKYVLDTHARGGGASLSSTHDANAWPAERYAGLPAPAAGERVILWLQNSHACAIPAGAITLDRMGGHSPAVLDAAIPAYATHALDVDRLLPGVQWPSQLELRAGRYVVRPRYEITRAARTRIAHVNVERPDLRPDPAIRSLSPALGRGYLLPFPILPRSRYRTLLQPTPMAATESNTPLRLDIFDAAGKAISQTFIGVLPRAHDCVIDLDALLPGDERIAVGHAELVYDFRDGGEANGWLHALFRYEDRQSGHVAESSFGAHVFNTLMTYRNEPQSYRGPPPGLSTRLYLRLDVDDCESFGVILYPASARWRPQSETALELYSAAGTLLDRTQVRIACSGSMTIRPRALFGDVLLRRAGTGGYVLVRDATCRLFGFHGLETADGRFSFDHMFGF
jgi:hypothetical protein